MKEKTYRLLLAALAVIFSASCTKEVQNGSETHSGEFVTFSATSDGGTRTILSGTRVLWQEGDEVAVWYGKLDSAMMCADYSVGSIDKSDGRLATLNGFAKESPAYMAVYPLSASIDCSKKGKLTVAIPTVQNVVENSFNAGANVSVAYSEERSLTFHNVGGLMALKLKSTGGHLIKSIRLAGTDAMSGEIEIKQKSIAEGNPAADAMNYGANYVSISSADGFFDDIGFNGTVEGYQEEAGVWASPISIFGENEGAEGTKTIAGDRNTFYLVVLPGSHTNFTITLVDDENRAVTARSTQAFTIERNGNTLMASIEAPSGKWKKDPGIFINEIHTHNNQIELWNPNDNDVDLSGWLLVKDEKSWAFPVGSTIPAKGYKVITAGCEKCEDGPMFGISGDKGFVLSLIHGKVVDKVDNSGEGHAVIGPDEAYGRKTDGAGQWVTFIDNGTIYEEGVCDGDNSKGTIKQDEPEIDYTGLVINELNGNDYNAENANDKFVEIYNGSGKELDLKGVTMQKDGETVWTGMKGKHVLAAGAYLVLYSKKSEGAKSCPAENIFSSGISAKSAVRVQLLTPKGESIDDFNYDTYSGTPAPASYGRNSGSGEWYYQSATPGAVNADGTEKVTGLQ